MDDTRRVLIVDDDPAVREIVAAILRRDGVVTDLAADGEQATAMLTQATYSAVVLDLLMPRMHGGQVLEFMKERGIDTPVIVMAVAGDDAPFDLDPRLVRVTMQKPFEIHDLRLVVEAVLRASR